MKPSRYYRLTQAMQILSGAIMASSVLFSAARAHETASGMIFDARCCRGNSVTGDCQPIPASSVKPIAGGLQITLAPGDHPLVTRVHVFQIEQGKVLPSTDGRYYACLWPSEDHLQCLYAPPTGF